MIPRPSVAAAVCAVAIFFGLGLPPGATGQLREPPPPAAYALEDVVVVEADGTRREGVTLVVRDGLLERVGPDVETPPDARVLDGEGSHVYPGLVDAWGRAAVQLPERPPPEDVIPWDASRRAQGFTPHLRLVDHLTATGEALRPSRRSGVVASAVFPRRGFASGLGAALLHRPEADEPRELVARAELGLALSFRGNARAYPSTVFGVMAHLRQRFGDAQHLTRLEQAYERNPNGLTTPPFDPDLDVLRRVAGAGLPAYFRADDAEEIRRVLALAVELGFTPVIVGGGEAWKLADELAALDIAVLVSLDFPEAEDWNPELDPPGEDPRPEEELEPAAARERRRLTDLYTNPARLREAGVRFALTSDAGRADLRAGARRVIEYGLSEEAALAAQTSVPANILGIEPAIRLVQGYAATFVVTDGPLYAEDTRVVYTFVEGVPEEFEAESESGGAEEEEDTEGAGSDASGPETGRGS